MQFVVYRGFNSWHNSSLTASFTICGEDGRRDEICEVTGERIYRKGWRGLRFKYSTFPPSPLIDTFFQNLHWQDVFDLALIDNNDSIIVSTENNVTVEESARAMKEVDSWYFDDLLRRRRLADSGFVPE